MTKRSFFHKRFARYLPVVVDVETGGCNFATDALLEVALVLIDKNEEGNLAPSETFGCHIKAFEGANIDPKSLEINGIKPDHPFRLAMEEPVALEKMFAPIFTAIEQQGCQRAVLVGHNAHFDLNFIQTAAKRCNITSPFHAFTCFDTASLSALAYQETVLARALRAAKIPFDPKEAHSAIYDAEKTAELFCQIVNRWDNQIKKNKQTTE